MADLLHTPAKVCYTAAAFLIVDRKILFIKHKKIGIWFAPGGHAEPNEALHITAERECFEETGVRVRAVDQYFKTDQPYYDSPTAEYVPSPILTNMHWVSRENYEARLANPDSYKPVAPWKKGCEQHLGFTYLVEPVDSIEITQNMTETDGIGWFTLDELENLETTDDIRFEAHHAFSLLHLV